jgi:transcriptional regulator with XRE-family HTH domain/tetratricopeptide (TPR) repeat protein
VGTIQTLAFGALLKRCRRAAGLTQEALAARSGYSAVYIRMLERGARTPLPATVDLLAEALTLPEEQRAVWQAAARRPRDEVMGEAPLPVGGFLGARPAGPLVAREAELGQIIFALDASLAAAGRLVLLAGDPGVGKTRLAQEVALAASSHGCLVASGRCYEPEQTVAYYPFQEALATVYAAAPPAEREVLPHRWPEVVSLLPGRHEVPPVGPDTSARALSGGQLEQQQLFWAVTDFVRAVAEQRPVALLLDDLHWADSASLALLLHLARNTRSARVLLVGTYREAEAHLNRPLEGALRDLGREQLLERVAVGPLSQAGTAALLASSLGIGTGEVAPELATLLHERAEGNPFFTQELLQALIERGEISRRNGQWERRVFADVVVPESVRLVIGERVGRLSEPAQAVLREASVLGQTFTFADLASMSAHAEEELEAALEAGAAAGLVRETGLTGYSFAHVLIQQALYVALPARRKQRLHRAAGEALEALPVATRARRVAELAYHFARSDRQDKALSYLVQAAEQARRAAAHHEEAALLGQAIEVAERRDQREIVTELRVQCGRAFRTVAMWPEAVSALETALADLSPAHAEQRIQVLLDLAEVRHWLYDPPGIRRYASEALALAQQSGREDLAAHAMCRLALADSSEGDVRSAVQQYARAFRRAGLDHLASLVSGVEYSTLNLYWLAEYGTAVDRGRQAVDLARASGETTYTARALANLGLALTGTGRYDEALRTFDEARRFAREHRTDQWLARATAMCGGLHLEFFDYRGAQALAEEARAMGRSLGWPQAVASSGIDLLLNFARCREVGSTESLLPEVAEAAARAQWEHGWLWRLRLAEARAEIALARGDWEEAVRWADEAVAQSRLRARVKYEVAGLQTRGQALAALGRTRDALASLSRAVTLARPVGDPAMLLRAATALLAVEGDDALRAEARGAADRIVAALPEEELIQRFRAAEPVRQLG